MNVFEIFAKSSKLQCTFLSGYHNYFCCSVDCACKGTDSEKTQVSVSPQAVTCFLNVSKSAKDQSTPGRCKHVCVRECVHPTVRP